MIKKITLSLLAVLILGSCANKFSLVKRKYNKGYHFSIAKNVNNEKKPVQSKDLAVQPLPSKTISLPPSTDNEIIASDDFNVQPVELSSNPKESSKTKRTKSTNKAAKENSYTNEINTAASTDKAETENLAMNASSSSDVNLILLFILAIFIPPLAIYLKKKALDKWFWITLILCLLSFSVFFFVFGGLAYLIAIIIALMVVFDAL